MSLDQLQVETERTREQWLAAAASSSTAFKKSQAAFRKYLKLSEAYRATALAQGEAWEASKAAHEAYIAALKKDSQ